MAIGERRARLEGMPSSKGVTAEILRAEQQSKATPTQPQETTTAPRTNRGKTKVSSEPLPRDFVPTKTPIPPAPAPVERPTPSERPAPLVEEIAPEIQDFLKLYNKLIETHTSAGNTVPEVPDRIISTLNEGEIELRTRAWVANKILKGNTELKIMGETGTEFENTQISTEELRQELIERYKEAKAAAAIDDSIDTKIATQEGTRNNL